MKSIRPKFGSDRQHPTFAVYSGHGGITYGDLPEEKGGSLPFSMTRTKHLAIDVLSQKGEEVHDPSPGDKRICASEKEGLFLYLVEESSYKIGTCEVYDNVMEFEPESSFKVKVQLGHRGIVSTDSLKEMSLRRSKELNKACSSIRAQDHRNWIALRRSHTLAEQVATRDFNHTVIFEPFGGSFGITRAASQ